MTASLPDPSHTPRAQSEHGTPHEGADVDVLVVGAGPTGLAAAVEAIRNGLSVRIVERRAERGTFSKALVVHARTMEVFEIMGVAGDIRAVGAPFAALNLHFNERRKRVRVDLLDQPWGDTAYPYWLSVPQHDTERVLERALAKLGGRVEWSTALLQLEDCGDVVAATVRGEQGIEVIRARWVIGCDGGRSTVREQMGIALERTGAGATFLLADVQTTSDLVEDEGHMYLAPEGLLILVPMPAPRQWRVIAHVASGPEESGTAIDAARLDRLIQERAGVEFGAHDVTWTSRFDLSHGVADRFRSGRVFLSGDAAHIHSPVGGQGLNTGVQDVHNLVWRLAESRGRTPASAEALLAGYESERRRTAAAMVGGVARMTALMTSRRAAARRIRNLVAPLVVSRRFVQAKLARGVGMLNLTYAKPVRARGARGWHVGARLPNPMLRDGTRLATRLPATGYSWVVIAHGPVQQEALDAGLRHRQGTPVVVLQAAELAQPDDHLPADRVLLVRPDRYVAAAGPDFEALHDALPSSGAAAAAVSQERAPSE